MLLMGCESARRSCAGVVIGVSVNHRENWVLKVRGDLRLD